MAGDLTADAVRFDPAGVAEEVTDALPLDILTLSVPVVMDDLSRPFPSDVFHGRLPSIA